MKKFIKTQLSFLIGDLLSYFGLDIGIEIVISAHFALTIGYIIGMIDFKKNKLWKQHFLKSQK